MSAPIHHDVSLTAHVPHPSAPAASAVARSVEDQEVQALYLHIPFCVKRCAYCDFTTSAISRDNPLISRYMDALILLLDRLADAGILRSVRTAYVGGGTPTIAADGLTKLVGAIKQVCPGVVELSCEANPESLDNDLPARLRDAGATRISLGVQSFEDRELASLGRIHDAAQACRAARAVLTAGLDLSCDLMCGIPLQDRASFSRSLDKVISLGAQHVSVYPLMVEEGTPLMHACESGRIPWPDEDLQADLMLAAQERLARAGMSRYEVASYALAGHSCKHNQAYWNGTSYLGIGTGAASMLTPAQLAHLRKALPLDLEGEQDDTLLGVDENFAARVRLRMSDNARQLSAVALAVNADENVELNADEMGESCAGPTRATLVPLHAQVEYLNAREAVAEDMMLSLRTARGMGPDLLARGRASGMGEELDQALRTSVADGLARKTQDGRLVPTQRGWLFGNELYGRFWDLAHSE